MLLTLAGRLALIAAYGSSVPYLDQWKVTGVDLLEPWSRGELAYQTFFNPINDHWNVFARAYSFVLILIHGRWDNLLEITGNAFICAAAVFVLVRTVAPLLTRSLAFAFAIATGLVFALPITWENTLMGVQVDLFLQLVATLLFFRGVACAPRAGVSWWLGVVALGLSFYTQRSALLAVPAAALVLAFRCLQDGPRRMAVRSLFACGALGALYLATTPQLADTMEMGATSWELFLDVFLRQAAWPLPHPGWALLFYLPGLLLAVDRFGRRPGHPAELMVFMLGVWALAQAAAIAYARGAVTTGFVSRYCDLLAFGFIANAASLALLWQTYRTSRVRPFLIALALAWCLAGGIGLWRESTGGHAGYNLAHRPARNAANAEAIANYLATRDPAHLALERIGETLYSYPPELQRLLDNEQIRRVVTLGGEGRFPLLLRAVLTVGPALALAGALGLGWLVLRARPAAAPAAPAGSPWRPQFLLFAGTLVAAVPVALLCTWTAPLTFDPTARWTDATGVPAGTGEVTPLQFHAVVGRPVTSDELRGAVAVATHCARTDFQGTLMADGPAYTGILRSQPFIIARDYLVLPVAGWPCWPGNGVRWRLTPPQGGEEKWIPLVGDPWGPRDEIHLWTSPVAQFKGWHAELHIFDGNDRHGGWVGVRSPIATDNPHFADRWNARVNAERAVATHHLLFRLSLLGPAVLLLLIAWPHFRDKLAATSFDPTFSSPRYRRV